MDKRFLKKNDLRNHFLRKRQELSYEKVLQKSDKIIEKILLSSEFKKAEFIHIYVSMAKKNEVNTMKLLESSFQKKKRVVVPKIIENRQLNHIEIDSLEVLHENNWGVPEPVKGHKRSIDELDLILVPMVVGDRFKNRIGYGKGYYDRFLKESPAHKMGLLFDCQLYEYTLPIDDFDIPLDILLTESERID